MSAAKECCSLLLPRSEHTISLVDVLASTSLRPHLSVGIVNRYSCWSLTILESECAGIRHMPHEFMSMYMLMSWVASMQLALTAEDGVSSTIQQLPMFFSGEHCFVMFLIFLSKLMSMPGILTMSSHCHSCQSVSVSIPLSCNLE